MFLRFTALITSIIFIWNTVVFGQISAPEGRPFQPLQIIHIQDAHANYTAQKNICELIERFQKEQGIDLVFVEGAVGVMDAKNLHFSPDVSINKKVTDKLARMGELSGADLYLLKDQAAPVQFVGLEDPKLYAKNLESFRAIFAHEKETSAKLRAGRTQLELEASRLNNKNLLALLRHYLNFELEKNQIQKTVSFLDQLSRKNLKRNLRDAEEQKDFPNLVRLLRLMEDENKIDLELAKNEAKQIGAERLLDQSGKNPRFLLEEFYAAQPAGFDFRKYSNFSALAKNRVYQFELKSQGLFNELQKLMSLLFDSLSVTESEKDLIRRVKEYVAQSRLASLELTREEWNDLKRSSGDAASFYQAALEREKHFMSVIDETMRKKKKQRAIVIAGGFHTGGLKSEFKSRGIDCQVVTPEVKESSRETYVNSILGNYRANLDGSQFPAADWGNGWNTQSEMNVPVPARQALVNELIAQIAGASLGAKKEESDIEKKDRRERVIAKMSDLLQVSPDKIREILDSDGAAKTHLKSEGPQAGWRDLLSWAKGILEDLDIADEKFIDDWQKYNARINRLEKRIQSKKERDGKYWEIDKKKKTARVKNRKLHDVSDSLITNLRDFIDDEIEAAWNQKGLLRRMQIAPFQRVRRSVGKLLRDLSGEEAVRLRRENAFGVAPLTLKQSQTFVEEQKELFQRFQQMHSPRPSYSRRHEKIVTSTVSGLDVVSEPELKTVPGKKSGRQKKGESGPASAKSLGAKISEIDLQKLEAKTGIPVKVLQRYFVKDRKASMEGERFLVENAFWLLRTLEYVMGLKREGLRHYDRIGEGFFFRVNGLQAKWIPAKNDFEKKSERVVWLSDRYFSRFKAFWQQERSRASVRAISSLTRFDSVNSAVTSLIRIAQHVTNAQAREALRESVEEEGFIPRASAEQFLKDQEWLLAQIRENTDKVRVDFDLLSDFKVKGASLGESKTESKFFRIRIGDIRKQLIFTGSLMVFMAFIFSFPDTFNEIFFQIRPLSPTFYFHEFLHGSWAPENLNIPDWAKTMIQFPPIRAVLSLMVSIGHPINHFVVQWASDFMGIWGYEEKGKYVSNILPNIVDMIFGAASLRISEKFHAASLEEGKWQRFFRNSGYAFFFTAMGYFTFSIVYFVSDAMGFEKSLRGGDYSGFANFFFGLDPGPVRTFLCGAMVFSFGFFFVDGSRFLREKISPQKNKSQFTVLAISASIFAVSFLTLAVPTLRFMQKNDRSGASDRSDLKKLPEKSADGKSLGAKEMTENQFADAVYREFRKYLVFSELQMGIGQIGDVGVDAVFMPGNMETLKLHDERAHIERILGDTVFPSEVVMIDIHDYLLKIADSISKDFSGNRKLVINQVVQKIRREALRKKLLSYLETVRFEITKGMRKPDSEKIASTMKQIDDHIQVMQREGCSIAFTLPAAQSWLAWKAMEIMKPDSKWFRLIERISDSRYDESQYLFLGILGPHLRQSADGVDVEAFPFFLESGLRKLDEVFQALDRLPPGSADREKKIERARRISRVVLTGLFFNPGVSVDNKDRASTGRYDLDLYHVVFNEWMREMASSASNPRGLISRVVREFPDLMRDPNGDLPLYLTFADKREDATKDQTGQEIIGLFDDFVSSRVFDRSKDPINIFDLIENPEHPLVREFMEARDWKIPDVQAKFLRELRSLFLKGDIFEDPAGQPEMANARSLGMDDPDEFINRLRKNIAGGFKGKSILTLGYGSRLSLLEKLKKLGANITEVDRNLDYLKLVRQLVKQMKQRIDVVRLDISKPFPFRGHFDAIVVNNPLSITPAQRAAFLSELTNVVKSGGVIVIYAEKIQPPKRGISNRNILSKFYEKYDYAKLAEAAGFQVLEHDAKSGWTVLKKRAIAASLGLAQLGHNIEGWAAVNELTERILLPEDRGVLGEKEFDRLIGAGPAEAKSLGDSVTAVVTNDYFLRNAKILIKTMQKDDRIFVLVKTRADVVNLKPFGKKIIPVQKSNLKSELSDRENIFSLEFLTGESVPATNGKMLRFKWDGDALTNDTFNQQLLAKLRNFLLTDPAKRASLLQQEGITPKGGFWFLDKAFVEFIDKIVASSLGIQALQRAA